VSRRTVVAALWCVLLGGVLAGCRVDVGVRTVAGADGAGRISVTIAVDDAVRAALSEPDLADVAALFAEGDTDPPGEAFADLRRNGWDVTAANGEITLTNRFAAPAQVEGLFRQLGGADPDTSVFPKVRLVRSPGVWSTRLRLDAVVDLAPERIAALVARDTTPPLTAEEFDAVVGRPLTEALRMRFDVELAGTPQVDEAKDSTAEAVAPGSWDIAVGQRLEATVASDATNPTVWIAVGALVVSLGLASLVYRRRRGVTPRSMR
jgi:hypothetical protein